MSTLLISVVAVYLYGLHGLLIAAGFMAYLACVPLMLLSRPLIRATESLKVPADFSSLAFYSVFGTAVTALGQYADLIILDMVGTSKDVVAVYSLASVFFIAALTVGGAVQSVATPMFTSLMQNPQQFVSKLMRWSLMLSLAAVPISAFLVLFAFGVETWFLGDKYAGLASILGVLMLKFFLWSTFAVGGAAMVGVGALKQGAWIAVATTLLTITIGFPLCRHYGVYGAAWTQVAVAAVSALLIWWVLIFETRALKNRFGAGGAKNA
jgi:O-antigen/teichoic acid export membrane protein